MSAANEEQIIYLSTVYTLAKPTSHSELKLVTRELFDNPSSAALGWGVQAMSLDSLLRFVATGAYLLQAHTGSLPCSLGPLSQTPWKLLAEVANTTWV